jgi:hypothetical protein
MHILATASNSAIVLGFFMALFHSFNITDTITEGINNFNVLDVRDTISGIAETLDIITETLIMLLLDCLEGLGSRRTLIGALEVPNEHGT